MGETWWKKTFKRQSSNPLKTQKRKHYTSLLDVIYIRPEIGTTNVSNNLFIVLNRWLKFWKWTSAKNNNRLISVTRKIRLANHHYRFIDLAEQKSFEQMIFFTPNCLAYGLPHTILNFRSQNIISTQDFGFWSKSITQGVLPIL